VKHRADDFQTLCNKRRDSRLAADDRFHPWDTQGRKLKKVEENAKQEEKAKEAEPQGRAAVLHARLNAMHKVMRVDSDDEGDDDAGWSSDD
jgi:hypothetical protein